MLDKISMIIDLSEAEFRKNLKNYIENKDLQEIIKEEFLKHYPLKISLEILSHHGGSV